MEQWQPSPAPVRAAEPATPSVAQPAELSALTYELRLPDGEVRQYRSGNTLTVHIGRPTVAQFLRRSWASLLLLVCFALLLSVLVWDMLRRHAPPANLEWSSLFLLAFVVMDAIRLWRNLQTLRGTTVITASSAGLTYHNAPSRRGSGEIARHQIDGLVVHPVRVHMSTHYGLSVRRNDSGTQRLAVLPDRPMLERLRMDLLEAMGMKVSQAGEAPDRAR